MKTIFNNVNDLTDAIEGLWYDAEPFEGTWDNSDIEITGYELDDYIFAIELNSEKFMLYDDAHSQLWIADYYTPGETSMALVSAMINFLAHSYSGGPFKVSSLTSQTEIPKYDRRCK